MFHDLQQYYKCYIKGMLSLTLIVKDEEKNLARCLDSVKGLWDELVIVDTGSTDRTVEIAKQYTDNVYHFTWVKHFAKARNFAFSKCTQPWILWLDGDDALQPQDVKNIRDQFLKMKDSNCDFMLIDYYYWVEPPTLSGTVKAVQLRERIIRKSKANWVGRCHEINIVDWSKSYFIQNAGVWHLRSNEDRQKDDQRNLELMLLEVEENPSQRNNFYLGNEYVGVGKHKEATEAYLKAYDLNSFADDTFQAAYKLAQSYQELGNLEDAILWYLKAIKLKIEYREPLLGLGAIYTSLKDYRKAVFWLEKALTISEPKNPAMIILKENYTWIPYDPLAKAYFQLKEFKKAAETLEKLYEILKQPSLLKDIELSLEELKKTYKRPNSVIKLNLGSGGKTIPGFINCDLFPQLGVDEIFSLDEIPYADCSVDEISSEHALEHLPRLQGEKALKEWFRVLKPGGKVDLKIPDLVGCCNGFLNDIPNREWYKWTIYGIQDHRHTDYPFKDKTNTGQIHYNGFTKESITELMSKSGFIVNSIENYDGFSTPSMHIKATKPFLASAKRIAFINNTLNPKYLSYGDYWEDAFCAAGNKVDVYRYEKVSQLPTEYDLYFFIEAGGRYDITELSDVHPRVLYSQEQPSSDELNHFDLIATPDLEKMHKWSSLGNKVIHLPNENHVEKVFKLMNLKIENRSVQKIKLPKPVRLSSYSEFTDIIIPSYKSLKYLKLTVESVKRNSKNFNLIMVNSGDDSEVRSYLQQESGITLIDSQERLSFSQAVNKGLKASNNDVVILNNDVIVGENWLSAFRKSPFDITNPFSNCDAGWIHDHYPVVGNVKLHPNMQLGDVDNESLMNYQSPFTEIIKRDQPGQSWVAFYATYIKKKVIDSVGLLDDTFLNGGEDYDYCRRAVKLGFNCGHVFSSWVFHFGGKTRKVSEDENYVQHHKEDDFNNAHMKFKDRPTVVIYTGQAWEQWNIRNINTIGIGGSETCAALLSREFSKLGMRSILFGDCEDEVIDGVEYINWQKFDYFKERNYIDYFISSRTTDPLRHQIKNGRNFVWAHDIFLQNISNIEKIDKFICLSPWHIDFFSDHHKIDKNKIYMQPNGIDLTRYDNQKIDRDPFKLIYSSSPDRGLINLLKIFPILKKIFPKLTLHVFYGFDNWTKCIAQRNNPQEKEHMNAILALMKQDGIVYRGRVSQIELAKEQLSSALWVYPTFFTETFAIGAIESMYAGAVPVIAPLAALETTVPDDCGIKENDVNKFVDIISKLIVDNARLKQYRKKGREFVKHNFPWEKIAQNWIKMFQEV